MTAEGFFISFSPKFRPLKTAAALGGLLAVCLCSEVRCGAGPDRARDHPAGRVQAVLEERVGATAAAGPIFCRRDRVCGSDVLPLFYRGRGLRPAWIRDDLDLSAAASLLLALRRVEEDGLNPENYHLQTLQELIPEVSKNKGKGVPAVPAETLADLEMLLTDAFLLCGSHLVHGQVNPETIQSEWFIKGRYEDLAAVLERGLESKDIGAALDSLKPVHSTYLNLKSALRKLRADVDSGRRPDLSPGQKFITGDTGPRVIAVRDYLKAAGDLPSALDGGKDLFDSGLGQAVKSFQLRHGLEVDGVLGPETRAAMSVSPEYRLRQVRANLERWRWITSDLGDRYILTNIADFSLHLIAGEKEVMSMPAIVGRTYRRTPEFSARMTYLEVNPFWNVPPRLAREDILPKVQENKDYLKVNGIRIFRDWNAGASEIDPDSIDWPDIAAGSLTLKFRQEPGPLNSLGQIKFVFPNKFDVYLHDTPAKELFKKAVRDFSSGCIRVERPIDLALYLLKEDPEWDEAKLREEIQTGRTRIIPLKHPINVHVLYWTAWMDREGHLHFREDIYKRDAALYGALNQKSNQGGQ